MVFRKVSLWAAAAAFTFLSGAAMAFPDKPVNYIIPFNPGGESDVSARLQQPFFKKVTGQDVIIQYQAGAGGAQAWSVLNDQPGDGHTIMGTNLPHIVLQPLIQDPGYETDDLTNVYMFHFTPDALIVRADSEFETVQQVIDAAKEAPGQLLAGGSATNSANHIANQLFANETGAELTYIPFTGTGASVPALLGGEVNVLWGYTTIAAGQGDEVRMLAVAQEERHPLFPDVPTFKELGIDMVGGAYRGIAVPKSTPEDIRKELSDIIGKINADPEFIERMEAAGFAMLDVPYEEMDAFMAERKKTYGEIAKQLEAAQ
ncbi:tripartite tricarboxylate transporter substrate binding protein [Chelativorans sp. M5D2P16]|uniref:tripartite tricarboxylate transporter substrate binding protein n=1 Tax=Chelativorans sp. M5D2P16 TaxID=3095678 RepID=UPI002ACA1EB3|nr:tripartite tricarboxylate transporter substrate binding protein [Chelativorans sp. M5D2P16]MDZ5695924.1 tripartite tricarboxylate transporter substrate binding protein [Chelativorans sp. M5D2P16]